MALRSLLSRALVAAFTAGLSIAAAEPAYAVSGFLEVPPREEVIASPAYRYANMSNDEAFAELDRRSISYVKVAPIGGVRAPIRLKGRLHGVDIHSSLSVEERKESMFEVLDARLALALDDFSVILARHDIVEVVHYTMYRPNAPSPAELAAAAKAAKEAEAKADPKSNKGNSKAKADPKIDGRRKPDAKTKEADKRAPAQGAKHKPSLDGKAAKPEKNARRPGNDTGSKKKEGLDKGIDFDLLLETDHDASAQGFSEALAKGAPQKKVAAAQKAPSSARKSGSRKPAKTRILPKSEEHAHGKWAAPGTRHPAGLAIDVGILKRQDGTTLNVASHFLGRIGERTCGEGARVPESDDARELRAIVCEARESELFTYTLTPNFNADHFDHFHMEIKPQVEWFLYH